MNKLILCEGATDAILLSYYLERTAGWKFVRQPPQGVSIRATEQNEEVTWYKKNNDYLLICAVGGKDNFGKFFDDKIQKPLVMSDAFEKIAIVADLCARPSRTRHRTGLAVRAAEPASGQHQGRGEKRV